MNYIKIDTCDIANGKDVGVVLWVAGCDIHCEGCHNQSTWCFDAGKKFTEDTMNVLISELKKPYIRRLTLSGGHPLAPQNAACVANIIKTVRWMVPDIQIWIYTGYKFEDAVNMGRDCVYAVRNADVVVDGAFILTQRNISLPFRGSDNQRVIDVKASALANKIVLYDV